MSDDLAITAPVLRLGDIKAAVAARFNVSVEELVGPRLFREFSIPRQVAYYIARKRTNYSLPRIAREFGRHDHTTVICGIRNIEKRVTKFPELQDDIDAIVARLDADSAGD